MPVTHGWHLPMFTVRLAVFQFRSASPAKLGGQVMARRGVFVRCEEVAFLEEAARWRQQCILVLTQAKPQGPFYKATSKIVDAINDVAEVVTGDRRRFHRQSPRTPGPCLPPVKWRTVE
jgi:hypothetical protein